MNLTSNPLGPYSPRRSHGLRTVRVLLAWTSEFVPNDRPQVKLERAVMPCQSWEVTLVYSAWEFPKPFLPSNSNAWNFRQIVGGVTMAGEPPGGFMPGVVRPTEHGAVGVLAINIF